MEQPTIPDTDGDTLDHGVDEYVSDCNRLPFAGPLDGAAGRCGMVGCILLLLIACGGAYGVYRLITMIIR